MARTVHDTQPDGWRITYTIDKDANGASVITSLTMKPDGPVPEGGLTATRLRQIPMGTRVVARTYRDVAATGTYQDLKNTGDSYADVSDKITMMPRRGKRHDPRFLAEVADLYSRLVKAGAPNVYDVMQEELGRRGFDYRRAGIRELIRKAHQRGLLTPTARGTAGGELTPKAIRLLKDRDGQ